VILIEGRLYDFYELLLAGDVEGDRAHDELVGEDADRPQIVVLAVWLPLQDLR
jgi:hypothetical protein